MSPFHLSPGSEQGNDVGQKCDEKRRHLFDSQSYLPRVIRIETPSGFFFLFSFSHCRREKEGRGERRRPQVTFGIISSMPGVNEWEREREEWWGHVGVKVKVWKRERCVHFLSGLLGGSRQWILTEPHLVAHCLVSAKCVKTPPTKRTEREQAQC